VRDEPAGLYAGDESTREFAARLRAAAAGPPAPANGSRRSRHPIRTIDP
jgi:hypothetical protein